MHLPLILLFLAQSAAPPRSQPVPDPRYGSEEALQRYAVGRMLEERGQLPAALDEYYRALFLEPKSLEIARRVSEVALEMGDPERSLEFAKRSLELDPTDARSQWLYGTAQLNLGHDQEALAPLQKAFDADTERVEYARTLARVAEKLDLYDLLSRCYQRVVWLDDDDGEAYFQLAAAEARQGRFGAADTALAAAEERNPVRPGIYFLRGWISESLGRPAEARQAYQQHLQVHPDDQNARRRYISLLAREKQYSAAAREARTLVRAQPDDLDAIHIELEMLFESGAKDEAMREIERLRRERPNDVEALSVRVGTLARHGRSTQAVAEADLYLKSHPNEMAPQLIAARALDLAGQHDQAAVRLEAAVRTAPDSLPPRVMLGRAYESANKLAEAERVWQAAIAKFPEVDGLVFDLALCREKRNDLDGAEAAVRDVLAREPANPTALNFLGYLLADHNRKLDEAVELIQRALAIDPNNGAYLDSLGWAYYRQGRLADARVQLERAIQLADDPVIHEHLGDVYKEMSLNDLARAQYRLSLANDEDNSRVKAKLSRIR